MNNPPPLTPGETKVILSALQFTVQKNLRKMNGDTDEGTVLSGRIVVTEILHRIGRVDDITTLTAAILHQVFDSSASVKKELDVYFGPDVRMLVQELAGNTHLTEMERKQDVLDRAPFFSVRAKQIAIAEKIHKLQDLEKSHAEGWSLEEMHGYLTWIAQIVEACRGVNPYLEEHFDELFAEQSQKIREADDVIS
jgi:(p)ppGpp synthase/HD superfamily hydrolase